MAGSLEKHSAELVHLDVVAAVEVVAPEQGAHEIVVRVEVQHAAQICKLSTVQLAAVISIQSIEQVVEGEERVISSAHEYRRPCSDLAGGCLLGRALPCPMPALPILERAL